VEGVLNKIETFYNPVAAQQAVDEQVGIDAKIAILQAIPATNDEQQIEIQTGIAYLSLFSTATSFVVAAKKLIELTDGRDPEQLGAPAQVVIYLLSKTDTIDSRGIKTPQKISSAVDSLCGRDVDFGLRRRIDDIQILSHRVYRWKMALACDALIHDKPSPDIAKHLAIVPVVITPNQPCIIAQKGGVNVLVASWLTCELKQKGIDMESVLIAIQDRQHTGKASLLEAGMPFQYHDNTLEIHHGD